MNGLESSYTICLLFRLKENEDQCDLVHFHDFIGVGYHSMLAKKMGLAFQNIIFELDGHGRGILPILKVELDSLSCVCTGWFSTIYQFCG